MTTSTIHLKKLNLPGCSQHINHIQHPVNMTKMNYYLETSTNQISDL